MGIYFISNPYLHMAHSLSSTFKKLVRIMQKGAGEKSDIHMGLEYIYISEGSVIDTRYRTAIVNDFIDVIAAVPKFFKPELRD